VKRVFRELHELFLATQFTAFMSKKSKIKLNDFASIFFRHFTWFENYLIENRVDYNYDIDQIPIRVENLSVMLNNLLERIDAIETKIDVCLDEDLKSRILSDYSYIKQVIGYMPDEDVSSCFNANREYKNIDLSQEARDALTLFLFEESYKEYELIMVYNYSKAHSSDAYLNRIFQILIEESFYHLREFGEIMAEMGILAVPRTVMEEIYKFESLEEFLKNGIDEEINAKEECKRLSQAVSSSSEYFASFFEFINNQENYHIKLMQDALKHIKKS